MLMLIGPETAPLPHATCYLREITGLSLPSVMYHAVTHASVKALNAFGCRLCWGDRQGDEETDSGAHSMIEIK